MVDCEQCIKLIEVIEDTSEDCENEKIYAIMEFAKYQEIMYWNENTYKFIPNQIFLVPQ